MFTAGDLSVPREAASGAALGVDNPKAIRMHHIGGHALPLLARRKSRICIYLRHLLRVDGGTPRNRLVVHLATRVAEAQQMSTDSLCDKLFE
jgi:hypothetical protein